MARATARPRDARSASSQATAAARRRVRWRWLALTGLAVLAVAAALLYLSGGRAGGGATLSTLRTADFHALAFSPADPRVVLAISVSGRDGLVYRSDDGGASWGSGR